MDFSPPGHLHSPDAVRAAFARIAPDLCLLASNADAARELGRPVQVLGRRLPNRFCIHPMEGWDAEVDGSPSPFTLRRWRNFGRSGAALVWGGEAFAIRSEGRANPHQLFANPAGDTRGSLSRLLDEVRAGRREIGGDPDDLAIGLQLTHSGRFARPTPAGAAPLCVDRNPVLALRQGLPPDHAIATDDELRRLRDAFVETAALASSVGFDVVDVKCCHGYLLHELLAARLRPGPYGGDLDGRSRLVREIVAGIRERCPRLPVGVRLSVSDGVPMESDPDLDGVGRPQHRPPGPWLHSFGVDPSDPERPELDEPIRLVEALASQGVELVNVTLGSPYWCPHLQRPASRPPSDGYWPPRDPLHEVVRHLRATRVIKQRLPWLVVVGSGYSYLQEWLAGVGAHEIRSGGTDLVGIGRMVLSYPEFPLDILAGRTPERRRICRTFSDCTSAPRNGLRSGCYPLDPAYRDLPEARRVRALRPSPPGPAPTPRS